MDEQVMPKVAGKGFRCSCGCNVFTKYETGRYRCNSCRVCYESEKAAPISEELPITDVQKLKTEIAALANYYCVWNFDRADHRKGLFDLIAKLRQLSA
jgi:hypothetical protein